MVKTAGNTLKWGEHPLTVAGKGGYAIREGNTYNLIGGELPVGQSFAIFLDLAQTPATITEDTFGYTRRVFDYSLAPLNRILNHEKFSRVTGSGLQDLTLGGTYIGTTQKIYRVKVLEDSTDPETIAYRVSTDGGTTFGAYTAPSGGANMSTSFSAIADGITIKFKAVTGHTETDEWEFYTGMPPSVEETQQTTGSGLDDLTLTVQSAQNIVATHRDIFTIKIMTAASPDTYQYSTDGGVTYNGSNINCATAATELGSTNVMVAFGAATGHTAGNIWKFHVFPTTTFARYAPRGDRLLVGWAENVGEDKTKHVLMSSAALGESESTNLPSGMSFWGAVRRKPTDQYTPSNSNSFVNDDALYFPVGTNETWLVHAHVFSYSHALSDLVYAFAGPTGSTGMMQLVGTNSAGLPGTGAASIAEGVSAFGGLDTGQTDTWDFPYNVTMSTLLTMIKTSTTAGNIQLKFRQGVAHVDRGRILARSAIIGWRMEE